MIFQELCYHLCIRYMPFHTKTQGFQSLDQQPRIQRRLTGTDVTQNPGARFGDEGQRPEIVRVGNAVIGRVRLDEIREALVMPVEVAAVHDHAAHGSAVPAGVFGGRVRNDVRAPLERAA